MRPLKSLALPVLASVVLCSTAVLAQQFAPAVRIVNRIDENQLVTLKGNTLPAANAKNDRGRVSPSLPMTDLILVLSRSPQQQAAFDQFVASQYDPASPNFHHWLEPEEIGANFGPSQTDIASISNWLTGHGFSIDEVSKDRMSIRFSGAANQVESTFHTEIHNLEVNGVPHIANTTDPQIPAALVPAVVGVKALHNFFPRPLHRVGGLVTHDKKTGKWLRNATAPSSVPTPSATAKTSAPRPQFGISVPGTNNYSPYLVEDVAPYDFAAIYNVLPLWNANIDGTGQVIAIAGTSDIQLSDVNTFRSTFGLPAYTASTQPQTIVANGTDPGVCTSTTSTVCGLGDLIENSLDVEWSGAIAKGAKIDLVVSGSNSATTDTVYSSANYVIQNKSTLKASILNVSYGNCELAMSTADNAAYNTLWQSAASAGIAVFVAAGDQGSAGCDSGSSSGIAYADYGLAVSGLASTPYNTAVGGTDFNWCNLNSNSECTASPYWNSSNASNGSSAKGYIPEVPWNDTCTSPLAIPFLEGWASYAGISGVNDAETSCNFVSDYYLYVYQSYGADLSGFVNVAGGGGGPSTCSTNTTVDTNPNLGTCTSGYAKPSWQTGVTGIPSDGHRDTPDVSFFASDGFLSYSAYLICVSANGSCVTSTTTTTEPTAQEVGGTSASSPAMAGVMALINQKTGAPQGLPNKQLYDLAAKQNYGNCSAENGTTGNGCYFNDIDTGTIAMPCLAGSSNCNVLHSGDSLGILSGYGATAGYDLATGLGSLNVANVVNNWPAAIGSATAGVTVAPAVSTLTANTPLNVQVTVASVPAGGATPTGTVTLSGGGYTSAAENLSGGTYTFTIPADSLASGPDTLTASYSGDTTYAPVNGTANITVTKLALTSFTVTPSSNAINSNQSMTVTVALAGTGGTPTGTVTLQGGGYISAPEQLSGGGYQFTIPVNSLNGGPDTLVVTYTGDATYSSDSGSTQVTVTYVQVLTPNVTVTPAASTTDSASSFNVGVIVKGAGPTPGGSVTLSGAGYTSAAQNLVNGGYTFTVPANSFTSYGAQTLTVNYTGDSSYASGIGTAPVTITQSVFALAASAAPAISSPGGTSTSTITVSSATAYAGTVTLACALTSYSQGDAYLPTCSVPSTAVPVGGTATVTVNTTAATSELVYPKVPGKGNGWLGAGGGAVLAFLVFLGIPARRRSWRAMLGMVILLATLGGLSACSGGSIGSVGNGTSGTTPDTYTFTVTGTGTPAVTPKPTITFTVTVN